MPNVVKEKLQSGRVSVGVWIEVMNAELVELCGYLGYDFAVLDAEHHALDAMACVELVRACELSGLVPLVRVPYDHPGVISGFLDMGCLGVYVPHVSSGAQARRLVESVKFPPQGRRGAGLGRGPRYFLGGLTRGQIQAQQNDDTMILALVEDEEGIENLEDIGNTEGVDAIGIGQVDLANSMGHEGRTDHPEVVRTVQAAQRQILAAGLAFDAVVTTSEEAERAIADGAQVVSVSLRGVVRHGLAKVLGDIEHAVQ